MGGAQTGTGKTAGFTLPLLHRLARHASTSHLARPPSGTRTDPGADARAGHAGVRASRPTASTCRCAHLRLRRRRHEPADAELRRGIEIVVATPGRLLDHVQQKTMPSPRSNSSCSTKPTACSTWASSRHQAHPRAAAGRRQSLLFSATFSDEIKKLADQMLKNPQLIEVARRNMVSETITHIVHPVSSGPQAQPAGPHLLRESEPVPGAGLRGHQVRLQPPGPLPRAPAASRPTPSTATRASSSAPNPRSLQVRQGTRAGRHRRGRARARHR
jgi:ATP-dependent RNA helicase RhlE